MAERFDDPSDVRERLRSADYLADDAVAVALFLADRLDRPLLVEGPAGVEPAARLEAFSLEAVKHCVEAGLGLAIVPDMAVAHELELGTLRQLPLEGPELERVEHYAESIAAAIRSELG